MQAGRNGPVDDGECVPIFPCDSCNNLQEFIIDGGIDFRPKSKPDLCLAHHGGMGSDFIIVKDCDVRDIDWSGDILTNEDVD